MGKATVYTHLGNGKYSVLYTPELTATDARKTELEALKTALDAQLYSTNGLIEARTAAEAVYNNASYAFFVALDDWANCARQLPPCAEQGALMGKVTARGAARSEAGLALNTIKLAIADNRAKYYAATQEAAYMDSTKKGSGAGLMDVWCIDLDPDQIIPTGTVVGTIETFGAKGGYAGGFLPRKWVNIQTCTDPEYVSTRDHCVKPLSGFKTAALFFNWCQWLYVMSRNPQHAVGIVLSKFDAGQSYLDVAVYGSTPGANPPAGYPFDRKNYAKTLLNLPVEYLSCGAEIFDEGDAVIVSFTGVNMAGAKVIGFAEGPRECANRILVRGVFQDGLKTKYMLTTSCASTFTTHANPDYTTIGWMDWIDSTGKASLWIALPGAIGYRRYGGYIDSGVSARQIFRRAGSAIIVATDVYGITQYAGQVIYVTKTSTAFEIRKTDETVLASIAFSSIVSSPLANINDIIDGWFKFSANGAEGVTMLTTHRYLHIQLSETEGIVTAAFSVLSAPIGSTYTTTNTINSQTAEGFCPNYWYNFYTGKSEAWGLDFIGNELNFLYVDVYGEYLNEAAFPPTCSDNPGCFYRIEGRSKWRWRIAPANGYSPDPLSTNGVLYENYTLQGGLGYYRPALSGSGLFELTDLDIRRRAAAFVGNSRTVLSESSVRIELNAVFVFGVNQYIVHDIDGASSIETLIPYPTGGDGGIGIGGQPLPLPPGEECIHPSHLDESATASEVTGQLRFDAVERADMFTFSNSNALFFVESDGVYNHYRYCDGDYFDITATVGQKPVMFGYKCS